MEYRSNNRAENATAFRAEEQGEDRYIEGYFAVFGDTYDMGWGVTESIDRHAFDKTIRGDIRVLLNHNTDVVLGRSGAGTAEFRIDDHGLWGRCKINPADSEAANAYARVQRGDVDQASFGFDIIKIEREYDGKGGVHRTLQEVKLYEVSVCTFPAYESTSLSARDNQSGADIRAEENAAWKKHMKERLAKWH